MLNMRMFTKYGMGLLIGITCCLTFIYGRCAIAEVIKEDSLSAVHWGTCGNPQLESFEVPTGTNMLIVNLATTLSTAPSYVLWNGVSMATSTYETSGTMKVYSYTLEDPSPSTHNITVGWSAGMSYCHIHAVAFSGVEEWEALTATAGTGGSSTENVGLNDGMVYDFLGVNDDTGGNWAPESGQSTDEEALGGTGSGSYHIAGNGTTTSMFSFSGVPWARLSYKLDTEATSSTTIEDSSTTDTLLLASIKQSAQEIVFAFSILLFFLVGYGSYKLSSHINSYE